VDASTTQNPVDLMEDEETAAGATAAVPNDHGRASSGSLKRQCQRPSATGECYARGFSVWAIMTRLLKSSSIRLFQTTPRSASIMSSCLSFQEATTALNRFSAGRASCHIAVKGTILSTPGEWRKC